MGIWKTTKKVSTRLVDVRVDKWMSWDYIQETSSRYKYLLKDIVIPKKATRKETFEQACERLNLTEDDLTLRKTEFTRLFYFFLLAAIGIIIYSLWMAIKVQIGSSLIGFCLALYALSQAFRYHFWLFQVKNRKLGCTVKEWLNGKISAEPLQADPKKTTPPDKAPKD